MAFWFPFHLIQNNIFCTFLLLFPFLLIVSIVLSQYVSLPLIQISPLKDNNKKKN